MLVNYRYFKKWIKIFRNEISLNFLWKFLGFVPLNILKTQIKFTNYISYESIDAKADLVIALSCLKKINGKFRKLFIRFIIDPELLWLAYINLMIVGMKWIFRKTRKFLLYSLSCKFYYFGNLRFLLRKLNVYNDKLYSDDKLQVTLIQESIRLLFIVIIGDYVYYFGGNTLVKVKDVEGIGFVFEYIRRNCGSVRWFIEFILKKKKITLDILVFLQRLLSLYVDDNQFLGFLFKLLKCNIQTIKLLDSYQALGINLLDWLLSKFYFLTLDNFVEKLFVKCASVNFCILNNAPQGNLAFQFPFLNAKVFSKCSNDCVLSLKYIRCGSNFLIGVSNASKNIVDWISNIILNYINSFLYLDQILIVKKVIINNSLMVKLFGMRFEKYQSKDFIKKVKRYSLKNKMNLIFSKKYYLRYNIAIGSNKFRCKQYNIFCWEYKQITSYMFPVSIRKKISFFCIYVYLRDKINNFSVIFWNISALNYFVISYIPRKLQIPYRVLVRLIKNITCSRYTGLIINYCVMLSYLLWVQEYSISVLSSNLMLYYYPSFENQFLVSKKFTVRLLVDTALISRWLYSIGIINKFGYPLVKRKLILLDDFIIILYYRRLAFKLIRHYLYANDWVKLYSILFKLKISLMKTLGAKYKLSVNAIKQIYGNSIYCSALDGKFISYFFETDLCLYKHKFLINFFRWKQ